MTGNAQLRELTLAIDDLLKSSMSDPCRARSNEGVRVTINTTTAKVERVKSALADMDGQAPTPTAWEPHFDVMSHEQEKLAIQFCVEISGKLGEKCHHPDPVRLLEMAEALYIAERNDFRPAPVQSAPRLPQQAIAVISEVALLVLKNGMYSKDPALKNLVAAFDAWIASDAELVEIDNECGACDANGRDLADSMLPCPAACSKVMDLTP